MAIFWQSNGNFPKGQLHSANSTLAFLQHNMSGCLMDVKAETYTQIWVYWCSVCTLPLPPSPPPAIKVTGACARVDRRRSSHFTTICWHPVFLWSKVKVTGLCVFYPVITAHSILSFMWLMLMHRKFLSPFISIQLVNGGFGCLFFVLKLKSDAIFGKKWKSEWTNISVQYTITYLWWINHVSKSNE